MILPLHSTYPSPQEAGVLPLLPGSAPGNCRLVESSLLNSQACSGSTVAFGDSCFGLWPRVCEQEASPRKRLLWRWLVTCCWTPRFPTYLAEVSSAERKRLVLGATHRVIPFLPGVLDKKVSCKTKGMNFFWKLHTLLFCLRVCDLLGVNFCERCQMCLDSLSQREEPKGCS